MLTGSASFNSGIRVLTCCIINFFTWEKWNYRYYYHIIYVSNCDPTTNFRPPDATWNSPFVGIPPPPPKYHRRSITTKPLPPPRRFPNTWIRMGLKYVRRGPSLQPPPVVMKQELKEIVNCTSVCRQKPRSLFLGSIASIATYLKQGTHLNPPLFRVDSDVS